MADLINVFSTVFYDWSRTLYMHSPLQSNEGQCDISPGRTQWLLITNLVKKFRFVIYIVFTIYACKKFFLLYLKLLKNYFDVFSQLDEIQNCNRCKKAITNAKENALCAGGCHRYYHIECTRLKTHQAYMKIGRVRRAKWKCDFCQERAMEQVTPNVRRT